MDLADVSPKALEVASRNLARHRCEDRVRVLESDLFAAIGERRYDVIVSNPPYVSAAELARLPEEFRKEPQLGTSRRRERAGSGSAHPVRSARAISTRAVSWWWRWATPRPSWSAVSPTCRFSGSSSSAAARGSS